MNMIRILLILGAAFWAVPLRAAVAGVVLNGTTGRPQSGVEVTLMKLEQGMMPLGTTRANASGNFHFEQEVADSPIMLRADFEGVTYNQMIPPGGRLGDVKVTVYASAKATAEAGAPGQHVVVLEPSGREMIVNESFLFRNDSQPPVTYVDARQGALRFYLPPEAKGIVQVNAAGPGGMPLRETPQKTGQPDIYKVVFPIKPGDSRIDLVYLVPYQSPMEFIIRNLHPGARTRIAAPSGVTVSGEGLESVGEEPQTKASIFSAGGGNSFRLKIEGEGRLARAQEQREEQGSSETLSVVPAAIQSQRWLILAFALAILGLGFYGLYTASDASEPAPQPRRPERPRSKRKT